MLSVLASATLVVEDAGILPVEPLEDLHRPAQARRAESSLPAICWRAHVAQVDRQPVRLIGQLGVLADDSLEELDRLLIGRASPAQFRLAARPGSGPGGHGRWPG